MTQQARAPATSVRALCRDGRESLARLLICVNQTTCEGSSSERGFAGSLASSAGDTRQGRPQRARLPLVPVVWAACLGWLPARPQEAGPARILASCTPSLPLAPLCVLGPGGPQGRGLGGVCRAGRGLSSCLHRAAARDLRSQEPCCREDWVGRGRCCLRSPPPRRPRLSAPPRRRPGSEAGLGHVERVLAFPGAGSRGALSCGRCWGPGGSRGPEPPGQGQQSAASHAWATRRCGSLQPASARQDGHRSAGPSPRGPSPALPLGS